MKKLLFLCVAMATVFFTACGSSNAKTEAPAEAAEEVAEEAAEEVSAAEAPAGVPEGTKAPAISLKTLAGETYTLEQFKGKYVVLDFWASWCPDCRKETPALIELYNQYNAKGVEFLGISFDDDAAKLTEAVEKYNIPWPQVTELKKWKETEINKDYKIAWIPSFYIINPEGNVEFFSVTADKLADKLAEIIK